VLLMHNGLMSSMRKELVETVGLERAKGIIIRAGYQSGVADAQLVRQMYPSSSEKDQFILGSKLHQIENEGAATPCKLEMDLKKSQFHMELFLGGGHEEQVNDFGTSTSPVCWMGIGYASGYSSEFTGQPILFTEHECRACGHKLCRVEGKPAAEWDNSEEMAKYYEPDSIVGQILGLKDEVVRLTASLAEKEEIKSKHLFVKAGKQQRPVAPQAGEQANVKLGVYSQFVDMFFEAQNNLFDIEETILKEAVNRSKGNLSKAARALGMTRPQLAYRLGKIEDE